MVPLTGPAKVAGPNGAMVHFLLGIPGGVAREYIGKLEVRRSGIELLAIVEMDREDRRRGHRRSGGRRRAPL